MPDFSISATFQDLDRINSIVDQARNMAATARVAAATPDQATTFQNPFATESSVANSTGISTPNVAIDDSEIRINAAGGHFVIPRLGGSTVAVPTPGSMPNPSGTGVTGRVESHLANAEAYQRYAAAVRAFRNSNFQAAVNEISLVKLPNEQQLALSPFQSLCHFATGNYKKSAAFAYATAARTPLWNWQQLRGYYGEQQSYPKQYQALQTAAKRPDCDASTLFLTGYHHLILGHRDHAAREFNRVLKLLPNDPVTKTLLNLTLQGPPRPMN